MERWTLFTDGASNSKGSGAGLVLISPSGVEFMYALRLNFASTNNEAEYEALLAGLRMARKMKEVGAMVEEEEDNWMTPIVHCLADGVWPIDKDESQLRYQGDPYGIMRNAHRSKISGGKSHKTGILLANYAHGHLKCDAKVRLVSSTCSSPEASQNVNDFNHGSVAILPMGDGHPRPLQQAFGKLKFIIVAIDYFTKWIEAKPLMNTAVAHPQANGLVERANKSLMEGIKAQLGRERAGWANKLPNVLWAHRTSLKQSNGETPFSLTYGSEAVIPAEIGIPTHRTMMIKEDENEDELHLNMDLLQERR
ncbi:reverse transcriptase domain-containing protein [Tanacetum coccineum]